MCKDKHDGLPYLVLLVIMHQLDRYIAGPAAERDASNPLSAGLPLTPQSQEAPSLRPAISGQHSPTGSATDMLKSIPPEMMTKTYLLLAAVSSELLSEDGNMWSEPTVDLELLRSRVHQLKLKLKSGFVFRSYTA